MARVLNFWPALLLLLRYSAYSQSLSYALDRASTCNQNLKVYDQEITLTARSNVAPANPPLECIVYLESAYELSDGRYKLQIIIEQIFIEDCNVYLSIFNGRGASGNYLRQLGCSSKSTDIIYSNDRLATIRFSRPQILYQTEYSLTLTIKTYADGDRLPTTTGVDKLDLGAIIGIVIGVLAILALAILLLWCCCSGYIHNFVGLAGGNYGASRKWQGAGVNYEPTGKTPEKNDENMSTTSSDYQLRNGLDYNDPAIWNSLTGLNKVGGNNRNFQQGVPRRQGRLGQSYENENQKNSENEGQQNRQRDSHVYEPYNEDQNRSPRFRKRQDSRRSRRSQGEAEEGGPKETVIDEPLTASTDDDDSIRKPPLDSSDSEAPKLHRFESEPDVDTIASPTHVNAAVRASIPDLTKEEHHSPKAKKRSSVSPKSRKKGKGGGHEPDPMALPPEAFDPVFTTPTSQEQYPGEFRPLQQPMMPFMPYGMFPMVPGQQTYAYAYQTAPQMGSYPGNQGAYFVQSVPTADGDVQNTAFAMHSSRTPKGKNGKGKGGVGGQRSPDLSLITRGAAPPDPGAAQRSMAMKSFADPKSGMQTTEVLWTDTVPDPTDPKPGDSSQVTRKTITRVTTRSGKGELPTQTTTLLDYQDPNPAFLSPSSSRQQAALMNHPAAATPNSSNIDYYLGPGEHTEPPSRAPDVVHEGPSRHKLIKDKIKLGESNA